MVKRELDDDDDIDIGGGSSSSSKNNVDFEVPAVSDGADCRTLNCRRGLRSRYLAVKNMISGDSVLL